MATSAPPATYATVAAAAAADSGRDWNDLVDEDHREAERMRMQNADRSHGPQGWGSIGRYFLAGKSHPEKLQQVYDQLVGPQAVREPLRGQLKAALDANAHPGADVLKALAQHIADVKFNGELPPPKGLPPVRTSNASNASNAPLASNASNAPPASQRDGGARRQAPPPPITPSPPASVHGGGAPLSPALSGISSVSQNMFPVPMHTLTINTGGGGAPARERPHMWQLVTMLQDATAGRVRLNMLTDLLKWCPVPPQMLVAAADMMRMDAYYVCSPAVLLEMCGAIARLMATSLVVQQQQPTRTHP